MGEGIQKRVQPDLVREIEAYDGGSFSEKLLKWRNDVDILTHDDVQEVLRMELSNLTIVQGDLELR